MAVALNAFQALDVVSAVFTLLVAAFFAQAWRRTGDAQLLLFTTGFAIVGVSFVGVSTGEFQLAPQRGWDALRLAGQLGGAVVLAMAYVGARWPSSRSLVFALGAAVAVATTLLAVLYFLVPPFATFPDIGVASAPAHALMAFCFAVCTLLSARGFLRQPTLQRALVPGAFLAWALTKYTWLLVDLTDSTQVVWLIYFWRFFAILLLVGALRAPRPRPVEAAHAPS